MSEDMTELEALLGPGLLAAGAYDPVTGIYQYGEDDPLSPFSAFMNLGMNSVIAALTAVQGVWTPYTPTLTGFTLGTGSLNGKSRKVGKTVDFVVRCELTPSSVMTGPLTVSLPYPNISQRQVFNDCLLRPNPSGSVYPGSAWHSSSANVVQVYTASSPMAALGAAAPATWVSGGYWIIGGSYETP